MKGTSGRILLLAASLAFVLALAEAGLRRFDPQPLNVLYVREDGVLTHMPGIDTMLTGLETRARVRTNRDGLRDVERPRQKPPGVARVLVLGDSMVEGLQVELPDTMPKRLERVLSEALPGRRIDVINAGVSGSSAPFALAYLEKDGLAYDPDVVVVTFTARNDVEEAADAGIRSRSRFYELKAWLRSRSHLYSLAQRAISADDRLRNALARLGLVNPAEPWLQRPALPGALNTEAFHFDGRVSPTEARGYDRLFASWNAIISRCRARGIPVLFVLLPSFYQVTRDASALGDPARVQAIVKNDREPQDRVLAYLARRRAPVVDPLPGARSLGGALYFPKDQHFSAAGNAYVAGETAREILARGWLSQPR